MTADEEFARDIEPAIRALAYRIAGGIYGGRITDLEASARATVEYLHERLRLEGKKLTIALGIFDRQIIKAMPEENLREEAKQFRKHMDTALANS